MIKIFHKNGLQLNPDSSVKNHDGFTMIELVIVMAIISVLVIVAIPSFQYFVQKAKITRGIAEIKNIQFEITSFLIDNQQLPDSLGQLGTQIIKDPFGNNYRYLNITNNPGSEYLDFGANPLNTDYDLYSMGPDGQSSHDLSQDDSHDDIIRGSEGGWLGIGSDW